MTIDRRAFLTGLAGASVLPLAACGTEAMESAGGEATASPPRSFEDRYDPWIVVSRSAIAHNVGVVSGLADGRPIYAVIKNNGYGLGLVEAASLLAEHEAIVGLAVVKPDDAITLRDAGIERRVLLMGMAPDDGVAELVASGIELSLYLDDDATRLPERARAATSTAGIAAHVYVDTGMSRMGIPHHRAMPWLRGIAEVGSFSIVGAYTAFAEEAEFDREQLRRLTGLVAEAEGEGIALGELHAASSNGVYHLPEAHLDMVRPGMSLFGGYPSRPEEERTIAELQPAVSLQARVVRVEQLRAGDSVSYGRSYVTDRPTWIATLPAGHVDGYPRRAVDGARIQIGNETYPVIGAVSASHIIVEVGDEPSVQVGDVATLMGDGAPSVNPNEVSAASGASIYDLFMHLNPSLPRRIV